jgi:hypothetical protein
MVHCILGSNLYPLYCIVSPLLGIKLLSVSLVIDPHLRVMLLSVLSVVGFLVGTTAFLAFRAQSILATLPLVIIFERFPLFAFTAFLAIH